MGVLIAKANRHDSHHNFSATEVIRKRGEKEMIAMEVVPRRSFSHIRPIKRGREPKRV